MKKKKVINLKDLFIKIWNHSSTILTIITLLVTIWIGVITNGLAKAANELAERNQMIDIDDIELNDDNEEYYLVHPDISQGQIKKAYLVSNTENGIIYTELEPPFDDFRIDKQIIDVHEVEILDLEKDVTDLQDFAEEHGAQINDIVGFGLVFLDYSNQWSFYYCLIRPGIVFSDVEHTATATNPEGETIEYTYTSNYVAEQKLLVIDTDLINMDTVEEMLEEFNNHTVTTYSDTEIAEIEIQDNADLNVKDSKISIYIPYTIIKADEMIDIITSVKKDLY